MVHLGMSGRVLVSATDPGAAPAGPPATATAPTYAGPVAQAGVVLGDHVYPAGKETKHDHVVVTTDRGATITYNDARRFGAMDLWPTADLATHPQLANLGPEPLGNDFNGPVLAAAFAARQSPVKAVLMDQRTVAGLGNIYVCEALHRAGIHPTRIAASISRPRVERLAAEIRATLTDAIAAGGSSLRDYRHTDGELGYFQHSLPRLRPRGCALPDARLPRHDPPDRPVGTLDLLLPALPAIGAGAVPSWS